MIGPTIPAATRLQLDMGYRDEATDYTLRLTATLDGLDAQAVLVGSLPWLAVSHG